MRLLAVLAAAFFALTPQLRAADQLADKTPAYFAQRYGEPTATGLKTEYRLCLPNALPRKITVPGHFKVLGYQGDALTVEVAYLLPENTLAAVTYTRPRMWTPAQTQTIVMEYSENWSRVRTPGSTLAYTTPEKTLALTGINTLAVQTPAGSEAAQRVKAAGSKANR